jgi:protocatechuate 3,4-dioxygenase beta subunit
LETSLLRTPRGLVPVLFVLALFAAHGTRASFAQEPAVVNDPPPRKVQRQQAVPITEPAQITQPAQTPSPKPQDASGDGATRADATRATRAPLAPIDGRVVGDAGEPLAGVPVYAAPLASGPGFRSPRIVTSDEEGNFQFTGLEPGLYMLNATTPGYISEVDPLTGRPGGTHRPGDNVVVRLVRGGVITGTVTDQQGEPFVAQSVRAFRVRDLDGRTPPTPFFFSAEDLTDDRGVYRIYGLQPGLYVVFTGGLSSTAFGTASAYGGDAPTFYPSGTRDTAAEVSVRAGAETAGVDIRFREEQGHRVTGTLDIPVAASGEFGAGILLTFASTGMPAGSAGVNPNSTERSFSIEGVADGDYDLQATGGGREGTTGASVPQRVSVRGADVTGLRVTLTPLASVSGTLVIEPASEADRARDACKTRRAAPLLPQETLVTASPERTKAMQARPFSRLSGTHDATPDETGAFTLRALESGRYRLGFRLFEDALYVRSVQLPAATRTTPATPATQHAANPASPRVAVPAAASHAAATDGLLDLQAGQRLSGVTVRVAEGAASFGGRIVAAEGAAPPPFAQMRVHLVPQERERDDDLLRFYEATPAADGTFSFKNLAPGRYLVLARVAADREDAVPRPAAWDTDSRAKLRREAEAAAVNAELQPCQRTNDFTLRFPPLPTK